MWYCNSSEVSLRTHLGAAYFTVEAGVVPLVVLVLDLLGPGQEGEAAALAPGGLVLLQAGGAEEAPGGGGEGLVEEREGTLGALETRLVPVEISVVDVPGLQTYQFTAGFTLAGEVVLVAGDAGGPQVGEDVLVAGQLGVAVPAGEVVVVPVPAHGPGVAPGEDELVTGPAPGLHLLSVVPSHHSQAQTESLGYYWLPFTVEMILVYTVGQVH